MKPIDLTKQMFGELTVIKKSHNDPITRSPMWLCKCSCGVEKAIHGYALVHGHYKSCGCKQAEKRDLGAKRHIAKDAVDGTRKTSFTSKLHVGNKSGHKGVIFIATRDKWKAYIGFKGKQISLGYFTDKDQAIAARKTAEEKYFKPYLDEHQKSKG